MSNIRNPKDVRNRGGKILLPGEVRADDMAAQQARTMQALENHPFYKMLQELGGNLASLSQGFRYMGARFNALVDYLHDAGILATQPRDPATGLVSDKIDPSTPEGVNMLFEHLIDHGVLDKHPAKYGLERYIEEYLQHDSINQRVNTALMQGASMETALEVVREFNDNPRRMHKVTGSSFGLDIYLSHNPDKLSDEELDTLAQEFGLRRRHEEVTPTSVETPVVSEEE